MKKYIYKVYRFFLGWPTGLLTGVALATLLVLTLMPGDEVPQPDVWEDADKVAHGVMFGLVACAALMDAGRARGRVTLPMVAVTGLVVTGLGWVIELLQGAMDMGRSCEGADVVADAVGAFLLPMACLPMLREYVAQNECSLSTPSFERLPLDDVKRIYMASFPEEERRVWDDLTAKLADREHPLKMMIIKHRGRTAGFITRWQLDGVRYVEHFAVDASLRGLSIGSRAIREFCKREGATPVVLEVEPAEMSDEARRRIRFYERCGFKAHHSFPYIQPPYSAGLPEVKLTLMTCGEPPKELAAIAAEILRMVYEQGDKL
ncbi:MAG: GNAT family N-acetyltransferase [Bacteroides sp.]|nr:GNAT family N-acetyltransferase [Bacteroides sp.]